MLTPDDLPRLLKDRSFLAFAWLLATPEERGAADRRACICFRAERLTSFRNVESDLGVSRRTILRWLLRVENSSRWDYEALLLDRHAHLRALDTANHLTATMNNLNAGLKRTSAALAKAEAA